MASKHTIEVTVLAETRKAVTALQQFSDKAGLNGLADGAKRAAAGVGVALAGVATAAGAYTADAIGHAASLEQSIGAIDGVFAQNAQQMHQWAKDAAQTTGLSQDSYNQLATVIGQQLKNGGTAIDEIGGKTNDLIVLGADLASMFGGSTSDAVSALSSALKGERDPIEKYGVSLTQAAIEAKAAELGFAKAGGALSTEATQAATLALIMDQTTAAHGNFAKESDTIEGKQQRLAAQWDNMASRIGTYFLPALSSVADFVSTQAMPVLEAWGTSIATHAGPALEQLGTWLTTTALPALQQFGTWLSTSILPILTVLWTMLTTQLWPALQQFGLWLQQSQGWLVPLAVMILSVATAFKIWAVAKAALTAATQLASAAMGIFNAVTKANPIGFIITLIAGLVAGFMILWNTNEGFRNAVTAAWNSVVGVFRGAGSAISGFISSLISRVSQAGQGIANFARSVGQRIGEVVTFFRELPGKIVSALSSIGTRMMEIGRNMITSLANALSPTAIVNKIREVIGDVIGFAKRLLGIASPSKVFAGIGADTAAGLAVGIESGLPGIRRVASSMASTVSQYGTPADIHPPTWHPTSTAARGSNVTVNLTSLRPDWETAQLIADAVDDVHRRRGGLSYAV